MTKTTEEQPVINVEEVYSKTEKYVEDNKNYLSIIAVVLVAVIGGYFAYTKLYIEPLEEEARQQMWKAEQYFEIDSFDLALNGDGNYFGFLQIIEDYGMSKPGNLAQYYTGICYLRKGEYDKAIEHLENFDSDDQMVGSVATGAIGDAYMETGKTEEAISQYLKAAEQHENNFTSPVYLMKAGLAYELTGDFNNAKKVYQKINQDYPESTEGRSIDKYLSRAEAYAN